MMKRNWAIIQIQIGTLAILAVSVFAVIMTQSRGAAFEVTIALSVMAALFNVLAIPFFLVGRKQFKAELQRAYLILCVGVGAFGIAQLQLPLISLFDLDFWINSGGIAVPYLVGVVGIYFGIRVFAKLLTIRDIWLSPVAALIASIVLSFGGALLPHVLVPEDEISFDIALALSIFNSVFISFAAIIAFQIRLRIGQVYIKSMNWLCAALTIIAFAGWHYTAIQLTMTTGDWYYDYSLTIIPFVVGALFLVAAGYEFNTINSSTARTRISSTTLKSPNLMLDIVLYTASLISDPRQIDITLDKVREITSRMKPKEQLSTKDQKTLAAVFLKLENYLITNDPLRAYSQSDLRGNVAKQFQLTSNSLDALIGKEEGNAPSPRQV